MIYALHQVLFEWSNQEKCGQDVWHDGGNEWGIQSFGGETLGKETNWKT